MKVKELIEVLSGLNPEHEVILSRDSEGNSFSPASSYDLGRYTPESTWSGEWKSSAQSVKEGGCAKKGINAVLLWPVN